MPLRICMDHHVHGGITRGLRKRGVDVLTTIDDGTGDWDDERLLERATQLKRVIYTNDDDFLAIAHRWIEEVRMFEGVIYAHVLYISVGKAIREIEVLAIAGDEGDLRNQIEFIT